LLETSRGRENHSPRGHIPIEGKAGGGCHLQKELKFDDIYETGIPSPPVKRGGTARPSRRGLAKDTRKVKGERTSVRRKGKEGLCHKKIECQRLSIKK